MLMAVFNGVTHGPDGRGLKRARARIGSPGLLVASLGVLSVVSGCGVVPQGLVPQDVALLDVVFDRTGSLARDGNFASITQFPIVIGDNRENEAVCGFVSINLNSLPASAIVTKVVLNFKGIILPGIAGTAFADFGPINVDHVNVVSGINGSDYLAEAISASIGTVQPFASTEGEDRSIDVTSAVIADRAAGRPISSFRFRFDAASDADGSGDLVSIQSSVDDLAQRPFALVIFTTVG